MILAAAALAPPVAAQALPPQVLALYPQETGELVFVDLRALRGSRHYPQIKGQVLPERFRALEQYAAILGIEFDREVNQLSWAFFGTPEGQAAEFAGVAEGQFSFDEVTNKARTAGLTVTRWEGRPVVGLGKNAQGKEFIFAFADQSTAVFGFRPMVEAMLERHARGGTSLANNTTLRGLVDEVNGRASLWLVTDQRYTVFALNQLLPEARQVPGFDTLASRLQSAALRFELRDGLRGQGAVRCQTSADALLLSTLLNAALVYQTWRLNESNPDLARVLRDLNVNQSEQRLELALAIRDPDFATLLAKNSFTLNF
jgi:hypothetical protein